MLTNDKIKGPILNSSSRQALKEGIDRQNVSERSPK